MGLPRFRRQVIAWHSSGFLVAGKQGLPEVGWSASNVFGIVRNPSYQNYKINSVTIYRGTRRQEEPSGSDQAYDSEGRSTNSINTNGALSP